MNQDRRQAMEQEEDHTRNARVVTLSVPFCIPLCSQ